MWSQIEGAADIKTAIGDGGSQALELTDVYIETVGLFIWYFADGSDGCET